MPTRYQLDVELKSIVTADVISGSNPTARQNARKEVKKVFEEKCAPRHTNIAPDLYASRIPLSFPHPATTP